MKKYLFITCTLVFFKGFAQTSTDVVIKIFPEYRNPKYQERVELKAYLYNRSKDTIKIVNPINSPPFWGFYKDEWLLQSGRLTISPSRCWIEAINDSFEVRDIIVIQPGDSLYVNHWSLKFSIPGKWTLTYMLDQNPANSDYYQSKESARTLTAFRAESNELVYIINEPEVATVKKWNLLQRIFKSKRNRQIDALNNDDWWRKWPEFISY